MEQRLEKEEERGRKRWERDQFCRRGSRRNVEGPEKSETAKSAVARMIISSQTKVNYPSPKIIIR
jgi:hypothetical protein